MVKNYQSGFVLFAMPYEKESDIEYAKKYCVENGLTQNDVRISIKKLKKEDFLLVTRK